MTSGVAYLYRVRAVDASGSVSPYSNVDLGTAMSFTDDPLVIGASGIKARHLTELRQAVDAVRTLAALPAVSWTDPTLAGSPIKAVHVQELRRSLDEALAALLLPVQSYADQSLTGVRVKKIHIEELRERVR